MSRTHTERSDMDHTVYLQITSCLPFVSQAFTRWRHDKLRWKSSDLSLLLIYRPRRDERLSWPGWLTYSGWLTHISGYPSVLLSAKNITNTCTKCAKTLKLGTHYPCPGPWTRVSTMTPVFTGRVGYTGDQHGPWTWMSFFDHGPVNASAILDTRVFRGQG